MAANAAAVHSESGAPRKSAGRACALQHSGLSTGWLRSAHGQADSSLHARTDLYCHPLPLPAARWGRTGCVARSRAPLDSTTPADPRSTCGACG